LPPALGPLITTILLASFNEMLTGIVFFQNVYCRGITVGDMLLSNQQTPCQLYWASFRLHQWQVLLLL